MKTFNFIPLLYPLDIQRSLDFKDIFPDIHPIELELGAGDGSFITKIASQETSKNFIAIERLLGRLKKIERFTKKNKLTNLCGMRHEISYVLRYLIPPSSISKIHIYFPDPWPKKKHSRNRLFRPSMTRWLARVLEPGGCVFVRTDNVPYFEQMKIVFMGDPEFTPIETPDYLKKIKTDFECYFNKQGIETNYASFKWNPISRSEIEDFTKQK